MKLLRTIRFFIYFFGYMIWHLPTLRKGEKLLAAGDVAAVRAITDKHVYHWCSKLIRLAGVRVTVTGRENIPENTTCVFVANHRGLFDIPLMLTSLDRPHGVLAKIEAEKIPLIHRWMKLLRCVFVDRDDVKASVRALNAATDIVRSGDSFIIFPEGTRYKGEEGGMGEFKGGAFRIATKTGAAIIPVAIRNARACFEANGMMCVPQDVTVDILPAIDTAKLTREQQKALPAEVEAQVRAALQARG